MCYRHHTYFHVDVLQAHTRIVMAHYEVQPGQDLKTVEFFAGQAAVTSAFRQGGIPAVAYDVNQGPCMDLTTAAGMAR